MDQSLKIILYLILIFTSLTFLLILFNLSISKIFKSASLNFKMKDKSRLSKSERKQAALVLSEASRELSQTKTGAIIVLERFDSLNDYINLGVVINADINLQLILAIFNKKSPIHDGSVIIKNNKLVCTSSYLPPTKKKISSSYGSRHRAAIGISEITDAFSIIISETTGSISYTYKGHLVHVNSSIDLVNIIFKHLKDDKRKIS